MIAGHHLPFRFSISQDLMDTTKYSVNIDYMPLFLPDPELYSNDTGEYMLSVFKETRAELLTLYGFSENKAHELIDLALEMDELMVPHMMSLEEASDYTSAYNPYSYEDFKELSHAVDFDGLLLEKVERAPDEVIVSAPEYSENFDEIFNDDNIERLKAKMIVELAISSVDFLTLDHITTEAKYEDVMYGIDAYVSDPSWYAFLFARDMFREPLGMYYAETFFSEEDKERVTEMAENIVEVYKERLSNNDWLSDETIREAMLKLEGLELNIGYPEELSDYYSKVKIAPDDTLITFLVNMNKEIIDENFSMLYEPYGRTGWGGITPDVINAYYDDETNGIYFPAAFLQYPFYSEDMTVSERYGAIGAIIGHEISHAFDTRGAKFDHTGRLNDWWTAEDYEVFEEKSAEMISLFEGQEYYGIESNPRMTLNENIADQGGLAVALEALQRYEDANLEAFFESYARQWREKATIETLEYLALSAVHSMNPLRVNVQLSNIDEFYEVYDIEEGMEMFIPKSERVRIW